MFAAALKSALEPGTGNKFVVVLNVVLLALFGVITLTIWSGIEDSVHMYVFLFLAVGLTLSINWFIIEARSLAAEGKLDLGPSDPKAKQALQKTD